ncbi:hypothetical protein [Methanocella sp. MCL-LM]|uniref:hypothetical protein n=1 Tax=Methanocella sp. MCL-LM TaxID=3412035 RepID=UPI003C79068E
MQINKLSPDTPIIGLENSKLVDFWAWAYSDVLVNTNRSVLAEFIVGSMLGVVKQPRVEWDVCDLYYHERKIEVKCSAYLQSWPQQKISPIVFDIAKKLADNTLSDINSKVPMRISDCYVFCLFVAKDKDSANILDMGAWEFYVLNTATLSKTMGDQKSIRLSRLCQISEPVKIDRLKERVDTELGLTPKSAD